LWFSGGSWARRWLRLSRSSWGRAGLRLSRGSWARRSLRLRGGACVGNRASTGSRDVSSRNWLQVRADGADWDNLETSVLDGLEQVQEVVQSSLVKSLSVAVVRISGGEFLWVNHDNSKTVSVNLLLNGFPGLRARNVVKVGSVEWVTGLSRDREVPQVRVGEVVERWVHLDAAGEASEANSLHGSDGSVVEVVVWKDEGGWANASGSLDDSLSTGESRDSFGLGDGAKVFVVQAVVGNFKHVGWNRGLGRDEADQISVLSKVVGNDTNGDTELVVQEGVHEAVLLSSHVEVLNIVNSEGNAVARVDASVVNRGFGGWGIEVDLGDWDNGVSSAAGHGEQVLEFVDHGLVDNVGGNTSALDSKSLNRQLDDRESITSNSNTDLRVGLLGSDTVGRA